MFGPQTANQYQNNAQKYQDDIKYNPKSEANIKRKRQKSIKFQIEEENVVEAYVTHLQEQDMQDCKELEHGKFIGGEDHIITIFNMEQTQPQQRRS